MNTCRTCEFWDFKVSTDKSWGCCLNPRARAGCYVTAKVPDGLTIQEIHKFRQTVHKYCDVYFEEDSFGCIHHKQTGE